MQQFFLLALKIICTYLNGMETNNLLKSLRDRAKRTPMNRAEFAVFAGLSRETLKDWDDIRKWSPSAKTMRAIEGALAKLAKRNG